jgi:DNA helicase-2/ATP-dependent DNA helicase PcrA
MATELEQILEHIKEGNNFLLSGGAGSGKTYSLIEVIKAIYEKDSIAKIACITYTRIAVAQIKERAPFENLRVSTIHDFLWDIIKNFQTNLKKSLVELIEKEKVEEKTGIRYSGNLTLDKNYFIDIERIRYREIKKLEKGIISHDELIIIAEYMFSKYPLLQDILKDKYQYLLIDEYQDTNKSVIKILLEHLPNSNKKNILGFFGDKIQSIYESLGAVGDIDEYVGEKKLIKEIEKTANRRNPQLVIDLANKIRNDSLVQVPADKEENPPNRDDEGNVIEGNLKFLYSLEEDLDFDKIMKLEYFNDFNFDKPKENKELYLTNPLIAPKAGFPELMEIYNGDKIFSGSSFKKRITDYIKENNITTDFTDFTFEEVINSLINTLTGSKLSFANILKKLKKDVDKNDKDKTYTKILNLIVKPYGTPLKKVIPTEGQFKFIIENSSLFKEAISYRFEQVKKIYLDKEQLISSKKINSEDAQKKGNKIDPLIAHLMKIQDCIKLYETKKYSEFLRKTHYKITKASHKTVLKDAIEQLKVMKDSTIEDVIKFSNDNDIIKSDDDNFNDFITNKQYVYNRVKKLKYQEVINLFEYVEGYTLFSTQHNIKGAEFDNVFLVLDNGNWNQYNFQYLFENRTDKISVLEKTRKIFYVCCTRAKKNLIVFYHKPSDKAIGYAEKLFGIQNVRNIDDD